jgi:AcrR family transcriptional regulator
VAMAQTTKPMIYYHFGSKEGLFAAVLEEVYAGMREYEQSLQISGLSAVEAMRRLVEITFDYHAAHPDWVRLISVANIHGAHHITGSPTIASRNAAVVEIMEGLLRRGVEEGVFRDGIDPVHLHLLIASFCFYRVSNRHTWKIIFKRDLEAPGDVAKQRAMVVDAALRYLRME